MSSTYSNFICTQCGNTQTIAPVCLCCGAIVIDDVGYSLMNLPDLPPLEGTVERSERVHVKISRNPEVIEAERDKVANKDS